MENPQIVETPSSTKFLMSKPTIRLFQEADSLLWDQYVNEHPGANLYQLCGWKKIIEKTYGHKTYYLIATSKPVNQIHPGTGKDEVVIGILPLVHMKHFLFGNSLVSMPFVDIGGVLADSEEIKQCLLSEAIDLARRQSVKVLELRHSQTPGCQTESDRQENLNLTLSNSNYGGVFFDTKSHKVRMVLELPDSAEDLIKSFKAKLRSQIRKPVKEGLKTKIGGEELLNDFYNVFVVNMRDLGSPVHHKKLMHHVYEAFSDKTKIIMVYKDEQPVACSLIVGFQEILENPWASSLRQYSRLSPNMLLYWTMLEYACNHGYKFFDFGRSTPEEGTYRFKEQWGAKPVPLHWHYVVLNNHAGSDIPSDKSKLDMAANLWKKLPVPLTNIIGPMIRKHIAL